MNLLEYSILYIQFLTIHFYPLCKKARWGDTGVCVEPDSERWPRAGEGARDGAAAVSPGEGGVADLQVVEHAGSRGVRLKVESFKL